MLSYPDVSCAGEFRDKILNQDGGPFYFVFADVRGNFGYAPAGTVPKRENVYYGSKVSLGYENENPWNGWLSAEDKPYLFNPKKGFVSTANNVMSSMNVEYNIASHATTTAR